MIKRPEILSPAGNFEKLKYAIAFGADAVYLAGPKFGLRSSAGNFSEEELASAIKYAHSKNAKAYATANILPCDEDLKEMGAYAELLSRAGADAAIVSDLGAFSVFKKYAPKLPLHVSVQANVSNSAAAARWKALGAKRVILSRELDIGQMAMIKKNNPGLEIEVFVHGAICMSFSGRCMLSAYMAGRDANRGECAQPCRWSYRLEEEKREGEYFPVEEDGRGTYIFNSKDLCAAPFLERLIEAGIDSFKIEGRMKSAHYAAVTAGVYSRIAADYAASPEEYSFDPALMEELEKVSHREYSPGLYMGERWSINSKSSGYTASAEFLALYEGEEFRIKRSFKTGEEIEALYPGLVSHKARVCSIVNIDGTEELYAKQGSKYHVKTDPALREGNLIILRKRV